MLMSSTDPAGLTSAEKQIDDFENFDPALRPKRLSEFVGQPEMTKNLTVYIETAKNRGTPVDHVLLYGPPGLGKTTLAQIVANEMNFEFLATSAPAIAKQYDIVNLLTSMESETVLFIDEIHRLNKVAAETLYTAMEDFHIDLIVGEGTSTKSIRMDIAPFTLIGATTRPGMLPGPLRARFGIDCRLEFYDVKDLEKILARDASLQAIRAEKGALAEIARCSRGTPRIAKRLLRRVRDHAEFEGLPAITVDAARRGLLRLGIDEHGLNKQDRNYLQTIARHYDGGPVGIKTLAASLSEDQESLEVQVEPYLMGLGLVQLTPRGRALTERGMEIALEGRPKNGGNRASTAARRSAKKHVPVQREFGFVDPR